MVGPFPEPLQYPGMMASTTDLRVFAAESMPALVALVRDMFEGHVVVVLVLSLKIFKMCIAQIVIANGEDGAVSGPPSAFGIEAPPP